jgi:hypothetical protein
MSHQTSNIIIVVITAITLGVCVYFVSKDSVAKTKIESMQPKTTEKRHIFKIGKE